MTEIRGWTVRSNSFRPDYQIRGETLQDAITDSMRLICADALPRHGSWQPLNATAEWRDDILRARGGVEIVINATDNAAKTLQPVSYAVWIQAVPTDMQNRLEMQLSRQPAG